MQQLTKQYNAPVATYTATRKRKFVTVTYPAVRGVCTTATHSVAGKVAARKLVASLGAVAHNF